MTFPFYSANNLNAVSLMYCPYYAATHAAGSACNDCLDHSKSPDLSFPLKWESGFLYYTNPLSINTCRSLALFASAIEHRGSLISSVHLPIIARAVLTGIGFVSINIIW